MLSCSVMSNFLLYFGLYPSRLLSPWDSPGKNIGLGCHALLPGIFPNPGIEVASLVSPALWANSSPLGPHGKPICLMFYKIKYRLFYLIIKWIYTGFSGSASDKEPICHRKRPKRCRFDRWVRMIPWRRA